MHTCHSGKWESRGLDHPTENESREQIGFEELKYLDTNNSGRNDSSKGWRGWWREK